MPSFTVLTQNAWGAAPFWKSRSERLARSIVEHAPEVVGLQEIHAETPSGEGSQAHELAALAGGYDAWFAPGRVTPSGHAEGVALLVKRGSPVVDHSVLKLSVDPDDLLDRHNQRVVLHATLRHEGALVDVLATHLSLSRSSRDRTLRELVSFAAKTLEASGSVAAVVMGDFNATPTEASLDALRTAGWMDAWQTIHGDERGGTWPAAAPMRRIDYLWVQQGAGWTLHRAARTRVAGSDHVGVVTELRF
jgi:endonuclease/exonuclease/phosphatase family metal-dependent hydrolase